VDGLCGARRRNRVVAAAAAVVATVSAFAAVPSARASSTTAGAGGGWSSGQSLTTEAVVSRAAPPSTQRIPLVPDRAKGLNWDGLGPGGTACPRVFTVNGTSCTHGPDAAPTGVDASQPRTTTALTTSTEGTASTSNSTVPCYGDGTTGKRVQIVYAHASDVADRAAALASSVGQWAGNVDAVFDDSAAETGGVRHVRWATDASCNLVIQRVKLSTTGDDNFNNTMAELQSVGLNRTDRKYLVLVDATMYCGIATMNTDDSEASTNASNVSTGYARVDSGCWGMSNPVEAHELMHTLGAVESSAPHSTGAGHCTDANDRMCYSDSSGLPMTYVCPTAHERLFDCNHDDYYSTSPAGGSYLATHWNTASSSYLEVVDPPSGSTTSTTSPSSTSTTSTTAPAPSPAATSSWSCSLTKKAPSRSYSVSSGSGTLAATLSFTKTSKMTLTITRSDGSIVAQQTGPSAIKLTPTVNAGTYTVVVSGNGGTFTLSVTPA